MLPAALVRSCLYPLHERLAGRPTLSVLQELRALESKPPAVLMRVQLSRLRAVLAFALEQLPFYRDRFQSAKLDPAASDLDARFRALPLLHKAEVQAAGADMVWPETPGGLRPGVTGGSSGTRLRYFADARSTAESLAARLWMQNQLGVAPGEPRAYLWGSPLENRAANRWRDRLLNEKLFNAFEMREADLDRYLQQIRRFKPRLIYGYPSALEQLAQHANRRDLKPHNFTFLRAVVGTGECSTQRSREAVERTFGCPLSGEYGAREVGLIAHSCRADRLHIITPHTYVEILSNGAPVTPGRVGEVVCTTLNKRAQPLIRYRLGDLGAFDTEPCPCGLPLPTMRIESGKVLGCLVLPDGRLCSAAAASYFVHDQPHVREFFTHQRTVNTLEVSLVVDERFGASDLQRMQRSYARVFGDEVQVTIRCVDALPKLASGKRSHVHSDVAAEAQRIALATDDEIRSQLSVDATAPTPSQADPVSTLVD